MPVSRHVYICICCICCILMGLIAFGILKYTYLLTYNSYRRLMYGIMT